MMVTWDIYYHAIDIVYANKLVYSSSASRFNLWRINSGTMLLLSIARSVFLNTSVAGASGKTRFSLRLNIWYIRWEVWSLTSLETDFSLTFTWLSLRDQLSRPDSKDYCPGAAHIQKKLIVHIIAKRNVSPVRYSLATLSTSSHDILHRLVSLNALHYSGHTQGDFLTPTLDNIPIYERNALLRRCLCMFSCRKWHGHMLS
jgi:hypothetical protein